MLNYVDNMGTRLEGNRMIEGKDVQEGQQTSQPLSCQELSPPIQGNLFSFRQTLAPEDWWSRADSNRRPSHCQCDALPTELRPQKSAAASLVASRPGRKQMPAVAYIIGRVEPLPLSRRPSSRLCPRRRLCLLVPPMQGKDRSASGARHSQPRTLEAQRPGASLLVRTI